MWMFAKHCFEIGEVLLYEGVGKKWRRKCQGSMWDSSISLKCFLIPGLTLHKVFFDCIWKFRTSKWNLQSVSILLQIYLSTPNVIFARKVHYCHEICTRSVTALRPPAAVAQWLRHCPPEHQDADSIPGHGGRFSCGGEKQKCPCVRYFNEPQGSPGGQN